MKSEIIDLNELYPPDKVFRRRIPRTPAKGPHPDWHVSFARDYAKAMGCAYLIAKNGDVVASGGLDFTRSPHEPTNPSQAWNEDSRMNLASVSKPITAVAILKLIEQQPQNIALDTPFYQLIRAQVPTATPGVDQVTVRNLLTQMSGLKPNGKLGGNLWAFLNQYLNNPDVVLHPPGTTRAYSNTNFTILGALIEVLSTQQSYPGYVTEEVLLPMGIDTSVFSVVPAPPDTVTLTYRDGADQPEGVSWQEQSLDFYAPGGWISNAKELLKFLIGVRNLKVLTKEMTDKMFEEHLGWYEGHSVYGPYFHHNGGLSWQQHFLSTGVIHFPFGYDAVLLVNSNPGGAIGQMVDAFESRIDYPGRVLIDTSGPLPLQQPFEVLDEHQALYISGSVWANQNNAKVGIGIFIDDKMQGQAEIYPNDSEVHLAVATCHLDLSLAPGEHTLDLRPLNPNTRSDLNDRYCAFLVNLGD